MCRQATPSPARQRPRARSARRAVVFPLYRRPLIAGRSFPMTLRSWIRNLFARPVTRPTRRPTRWLTLEALEDRKVPSTFSVLHANDSGAGSLRQAILDANASAGADVINFDAAAFSTPSTIRLLSSLPDVTDDL